MTWWNGIAGAASMHMEGNAVRANTEAWNRVQEVNAAAGNKVRRANNALASAKGNLARYMQSINNNEALTAAGRAVDANTRSGLQAQDRLQQQGLFSQVAATEQAGRALASQGALGLGGSVVDNVNAATTLRAAIMQDSLSKQKMNVSYEVGLRAQSIASQMTRSLDSSIILDNIDYNTDVALVKATYSNTNNAIRGFAEGMGQGGSLYKPKEESPQQYKAEVEDSDIRVKQSSPDFTSTYNDRRQGNQIEEYQDGVDYSPLFDQNNSYEDAQREMARFNLNVTTSYGSL